MLHFLMKTRIVFQMYPNAQSGLTEIIVIFFREW